MISVRFGLAAVCLSLPHLACSSTAIDEPGSATASTAHLVAQAPRLTADVAWLAADAREGRRAGLAGEDAARDFLVARLGALGLEPAGADGFLQAFDVPLPARDAGGSRVELGSTTLKGADDVRPLFCSAGAEATGALAWVGFGVVDEATGRDDYAGLDVAGKVVLVARGAPDFPEQPAAAAGEHSYGGPRTSFGNAASVFTKVMNAKHRGAVGVVLVQAPGRVGEGLLEFDAAQEAQAGLPSVMVAASVGETVLGGRYASDLEATRGASATLPQPALMATVRADVERKTGRAENVLGLLAGQDPSRTVVIGAHYDHLGFGGTGSLSSRSVGEVHNGADDNASGTAAVLELARLFAAEAAAGSPPPCNLLFALWSGEELGLLGSAHWVAAPTVAGTIVGNVNLDMVGRAASGRLQVMGAGSSAPIAGWLAEAASRSGLDPVVSLSGHGIGGSDHQSFLNQGLPAVHLFTGVHSDYHKPSDDIERFEGDACAQVVEYARFMTTRMASAEALAFAPIELGEEDDRPTRERGWSAWFGSIPDYASSGGGLLITGVQEGSPAERAGLIGGDTLIGAGSVEIETIHDFVYALQLHKPGDVIRVRYVRGGEERDVLLTLGSRDLL